MHIFPCAPTGQHPNDEYWTVLIKALYISFIFSRSMRNFIAITFVLALLVLAVSSGKCKLNAKKLKAKVKNYQKKCLKKGFQSSLGCESADGGVKLKKKVSKQCGKMENALKKCGYSCGTDGAWSDFGDWSECSAACGGGTQTRSRSCSNPAPANGGAECSGDAEESRECNTDACPVDGGWSDFGDWSECSAKCGGGTQTRSRTCTNPAPANGGAECSGDAEESQECNLEDCPSYSFKVACDDYTTVYVDGDEVYADTNWQTIGSVTVPYNARTIAVKCQDLGGGYGIVGELKNEDGNDVTVTGSSWSCSRVEEEGWQSSGFQGGENWQPAETDINSWMLNNSPFNQLTSPNRKVIWTNTAHGMAYCRKDLNPGQLDGGWSDFGDWSECSAECGDGTQTRTRTCTNPAPANGGAECTGDTEETQACNLKDCPSYSLKVACDDYTTIYVDGVQVYTDTNWQSIASVKVPLNAQTIAVKCQDLGGGYGIVGELKNEDGNDVTVTGSSWSCSRVEEEGWQSSGFQGGENWQPAETDINSWMLNNSPFNQLTSPNRKVIWTNTAHGMAYCRKDLNPGQLDGGWSDFGDWSECSAECGDGTQTRTRTCTNPAPANGGADCTGDADETRDCKIKDCPTYSLKVACDDYTTIYVDGVQVYTDTNWQSIASVKVPLNAQTIAVKCQDLGGGYGIVGELKNEDGNDVTVTGSSWSCSRVEEEGWQSSGFQGGENWQPAETDINSWMLNNSPFNQLTSPNRKVIWTNTAHGMAYCRKDLN